MIKNGAILTIDERDFIAGGDGVNVDDFPIIHSSTNEFSQLEFKDEFGNCMCTVYGPIGVFSDNTVITLTTAQRKELVKLRYSADDFQPKFGGSLPEGVNITRNYLKSLGYKVASLRLSTKSKAFKTLLNKGYRINIGMYIKEDYLEDTQSDGVLNYSNLGDNKFGHSTGLRMLNNKECIVDNYQGKLRYNIVNVEDLDKRIDNGTIYGWAYVIFTDDTNLIPNYKKKIMSGINIDSAKEAFKQGLWNGERPTETASREEVAAMIQRAIEKANLLK